MNTNAETLGKEIASFIRQVDDDHEELYHELETSFREEVLGQELPEDDYSFAKLNLAEEIKEHIQNTDCSELKKWLEDLGLWYYEEDDGVLYSKDEIYDISHDAGNLLHQLYMALSA